jgi:exodeoxyribonuclease V alpha subunit
VARIKTDDGIVTAVGPFSSATPGQAVRLTGSWVVHRSYGRQFRVEQMEIVAPATLKGIERYLGSGLIRGIGPVTAKRIVQHFKMDTLEVIESRPEALLEVPGIGPKRASQIARAAQEHKSIQKVMVFLQSHGVSPTYAVKIYKRYGDDAVGVVSQNPYQLADEIYGIGFKTADKIAREVGVDKDSPYRIDSGIKYWMAKAADDGHCYSEAEDVVREVAHELDVSEDLVKDGLVRLQRSSDIFREGESSVWLGPFYHSERGVAQRLYELNHGRMWQLESLSQEELDKAQAHTGLSLGAQQRNAIVRAFQCGVMVLTGGPGTGKTTTLKLMIDLFEARGLRVLLAAPTGRAAKRLSEASGRSAKTIHRLLEFEPGEEGWRFARGVSSPLECDVLVVDEMSMVDILLMHNMLKAVKPGTRLVLVGDVDQLPSVGPGNVLRDIIDSGAVETVVLDEVFRQAPGSMIVSNAHRINRGEFPHLRGARDFFFINEEDPEKVAEAVVHTVKSRLPRYLKCSPIHDIQVLSPMRRTVTGVDNLNMMLRDALNPPRQGVSELKYGATLFRRGDKVMQVRNNYERRVFNGDMGLIVRIDPEEGEVVVRYPEAEYDRDVTYLQDELDELVLSYCVSVHKSQGSEYPAVVVPVTTQHYVMLQRNLIYTAVTRAREVVVLVGTKRALAIGIRNASLLKRRTMLAERLRELAGATY